MIFKLSDITRDVKVALDQNMTSERLIVTNDLETLSLDHLIRSKIEESVRLVEQSAPIHFLESGHNFGDALFWANNNCGWVKLPDDFMRLISFRMSDWERTVHSVIYPNSPQYTLQSSRFKGIRGNYQKPVCAIVIRPEGKVLEFYSCKDSDAMVTEAMYLPLPKIDNDNGIDICEHCYTSAIYMICAHVLTAYGDTANANTFFDLSKTYIE